MDRLKAASLALAREALVPPSEFDHSSRSVTVRLEDVFAALKSIPPQAITPAVAEYVYFPLHGLLQQSKLSARQTELVLRILTVLLSTAWRSKTFFELQKAQQLTAVTTYFLSPDPPSLTPGAPLGPSKHFLESPTSLHAAGFECLNAIFESAVVCGFGSELGQAPTTADIIAILLQGLQYDTNDLESQKQSILTLTTLIKSIILNPDHRALVLPRIASKLAKFVAPSNRKHYSAKVHAIYCLQELVLGCFSESSFSNGAPIRVRTQEWLERSAEPLDQAFKVLQALLVSVQTMQTARPELIRALFAFASTIFANCASTFQKASNMCLGTLLDILLLCASQSVCPEVTLQADSFLQQSDLAPTQLEAGLLEQIKDLPSTIDSPDEDRVSLKLRSLQKTLAYITNPETHEAVFESLVSALPLSVTKSSEARAPPKQIQTLASFDPKEDSIIHLSDIGLSLPLSTNTQNLVYRILSDLGKHNAGDTISHLCDNLEQLRSRYRGSLDGALILWGLAAIVRNLPPGGDVYDVVAYCFEEITHNMDVESANAAEQSPARQAHTALCCYVIGEVALNQGKRFQEHLVDLLHPMFSMLGDAQSIYIRQEAQLAISKVAYACGYKSPVDLALDNKDYLVDGISTQLNTMNFTPGTPSTLAALIYVSGAPIVPYLDDVFTSLFVLLDHYHGYSQLIKGVLLVFGSLASVIDRSIAKHPQIAAPKTKSDFVKSFNDLLEELDRKPEINPEILEKEVNLDAMASKAEAKSKRIEEVFEDDEKVTDAPTEHSQASESDEHDSDDDEPEDLAQQAVDKWDSPIAKPIYETLEKIAVYCDKLMTHESPDIRLAVLTLLTKTTPYLALNDERFLPLVHKTWPEAISRVFDSEVYVAEEGLRCLSAIAKHAGDFVSSRIDGLWPRLARSFGPLFKRPWPQFSNERRLQNALVQFITDVLESLGDVSLVTMDSIMRVLKPALLRGEFAKLRKKLEDDCNPSIQDMTWLALQKEPVIPPFKGGYHTVMPIYDF